jgi:hypothetical protein
VKGDPLDQAGQDFLRRSRRIGIHLQPIFGARAALRKGGRHCERMVCMRAIRANPVNVPTTSGTSTAKDESNLVVASPDSNCDAAWKNDSLIVGPLGRTRIMPLI